MSTSEDLTHLRAAIEAENISMGEILYLQGMAEDGLIPDHDVDLLLAAGVPEFGDERVSASRNVQDEETT